MAKKNTGSKKSEDGPHVSDVANDSQSESGGSSLRLIAIMILVAQLIISLGILAIQFEHGKKIDEVSGVTDALNTFFTNNVDGYGETGAAAPSAVAAGSGGGSQGNTAPTVVGEDVTADGEPFLGNPDATVVIYEYSDYECPFCGRFFSQAYPQLKAEYIDTGKVKFVFKDFPLSFHQNAEAASAAANCVYKQLGNEAYFKYHDSLFENQQSLTASNLQTWASESGVNMEEWKQCITDPETISEIQEDLAEGVANGVSGTPSFIINGELIVGAQPYAVIKQVIESKLNS